MKGQTALVLEEALLRAGVLTNGVGRSIQSHVVFGYDIRDNSFTTFSLNGNFERDFKIRSLTLQSWRDLVSRAGLIALLAQLRKARKHNEAFFRFSFHINMPSGSCEVNGLAHCSYVEGKLVALSGSALMHARLEALEDSLDAYGGQLSQVLDSVPEALVVHDEKGTIKRLNHAATSFLGYRAEELISRSLASLAPSEASEAGNDPLVLFVRSGLRRSMLHPFRAQIRRADKVVIPVVIKAAEVSNSFPKLFTTLIRSVADEVENEERLRALGSELTHLNRITALGEMAVDIAHEINQPLAALSNYLEATRQVLEGSGSDRVSDLLQRGIGQAQRAGDIVRRLQKYVSKGDLEVKAEPVERTIRDAVSLVMVGRVQLDVRLTFAFDREAVTMFADRVQVQQVVVNLLRNALDAVEQAPPGYRDILVRALRVGDMVEISVSDTGSGIPNEVIERLYEPFYSTKKGSSMGVGLTISRRIVDAHNGRIWAENREGGGACFRFTIPLLASNDSSGDQ